MFGELAMAGYGAYNKLGSFAVLPAVSTSLTLTTFTSQNLGAQKYSRAAKGVVYGVILISAITLALGVGITVFAPSLVQCFNSDPVVVTYGVEMSRRVAPFLVFLGISHALAGALRGLGEAKMSMFALMFTWCIIRVIWISALIKVWEDIRVIYWSYPVTWIFSVIWLYIAYHRKSKLSNQ